jgi:hypothetical protein
MKLCSAIYLSGLRVKRMGSGYTDKIQAYRFSTIEYRIYTGYLTFPITNSCIIPFVIHWIRVIT